MRKWLDNLYLSCGVLAAAALVLIAVSVAVQMVGRLFGLPLDATEISGFFLAACSFLAMPYTLRQGGHIRVTLVTDFVAQRFRKGIEVFCCLFAMAIVGFATYFVIKLNMMSYLYHDTTIGIVVIPFWIPQLTMSLGLLVFAIALLDDLIVVMRGDVPAYERNRSTLLE